MKKIFLILLLSLIMLTGCNNKEENEKSDQFEKTIITKKQITENSKKNHTIEETFETLASTLSW